MTESEFYKYLEQSGYKNINGVWTEQGIYCIYEIQKKSENIFSYRMIDLDDNVVGEEWEIDLTEDEDNIRAGI